jgi:hypothetical protein
MGVEAKVGKGKKIHQSSENLFALLDFLYADF